MKTTLYCCGLSYLPKEFDGAGDVSYQLPRLSLARLNQMFMPDYALLLLMDNIVMDVHTYEEIVRGLQPMPGSTALVIKMLKDAGAISLVDIKHALQKRQGNVELLVEEELMEPLKWAPAVAASVAHWRAFDMAIQAIVRPQVQQLRRNPPKHGVDFSEQGSHYVHDLGGRIQMVKFFAEDALPSPDHTEEQPDMEVLTNHLREHLLYAGLNAVLADELKVTLHDWIDAQPYTTRELGDKNADFSKASPEKVGQRVFDLSMPEFTLWHPDNVLKVLASPQVAELREQVRTALVDGAWAGQKDAQKILADVAKTDGGVASVRRVSAYRSEPAPGKKSAPSSWRLISSAATS